ncbi:MAG TPA: hypothetical protein VI461_11235 [Chitinophagaceae bacterium]|nr:hypothetical protein [Chitinophagaceae bacterium]
MKKIAAFILALFYLTVSAGATLHLHYCMGKLIGSELVHNTSKKCGKCGMEKSNDNECCKDELTQLKIENDQNIPGSGLQTLAVFPVDISGYMAETAADQLSSSPKRVFQSQAPPSKNDIAVYIRNCVFLI